jgi:hypothetical protein
VGDRFSEEVEKLLTEAFEARLKILSTTHFGMAAPVMNLTREGVARDLVGRAVQQAAAAFNQVKPQASPGTFSLLDYIRGVSTDQVEYQAYPSKALVRLRLSKNAPENFQVDTGTGQKVPYVILKDGGKRELLFVERFKPCERKDYVLETGKPIQAPSPELPIKVTVSTLENEFICLTLSDDGHVVNLKVDDSEDALSPFLASGVTYAGKHFQVETWTETESRSLGVIALKRQHGQITLKSGDPVHFERELMLASGLPYLYVKIRVVYPQTPNHGYNKGKAQRLEQGWDQRWQEVRPCEIHPALSGTLESPLRVWKHNYCDHVSTFSLDYGRFSKNIELDSVNNQITDAWLAVSDGERGLLVAQTSDFLSNFAFCPLRTRQQNGLGRIRLNPFGSYWGRQYRYATADTGLGNLAATTFSASDHINPYAPSYNGRVQAFSLLIAPYSGDQPPESIQYDAEAFAYPYIVLGDGEMIAPPAHHSWDGHDLGQPLEKTS